MVFTKKSLRFLSSVLAVVLILPLFVLVPLTVHADSVVDISINVTRKYTETAKLLDAINEQRANNQLPKLEMDVDLMELAMKHSAELSVHIGNNNLDGTSIFTGSKGIQKIFIAHGQLINKNSFIASISDSIMLSSLKSVGIGYVMGMGNINYITVLTSMNAANEVDPSVLNQANAKYDQKTRCMTGYLQDITLSPAGGNDIEVGSEWPVNFVVSNQQYGSGTAYVTGDTFLTTTNSAVMKIINPNKIVAVKEGQVTISMHFSSFPSISASATYRVVPGVSNDFVVSPIPAQNYTGRPVTPSVTVKNTSGVILKSGIDYTLTYSNNINVGTATVVVKGMGSYTGRTLTVNFQIVESVNAFTITVSANKTDMVLGESNTILATVTNGKTPIKYKFDYAVTGSSSYTTIQSESTSNKAVFKPAKDSDGKTAVGNVKINVRTPLKCTVNLSPSSIYLGNSVNINSTTSGGVAPYTYQISVKKPGSSGYTVISSNSTSGICSYKPTSSGSYEFRITVTDSKGATAYILKTLNVKSAALENNSAISATSITLGSYVKLTGKASGGTSPYTYKFEAKQSSDTGYTLLKSYTTNAIKTWTPKRTGTYSVRITVKDNTDKTVAKTLTFTVKAAALTNTSIISTSSIVKGNYVTLTGRASGGTAPYTYKFEAKEASDSSYTLLWNYTSTATKSWTPKRTGTYYVRFTVKDKTGNTVTKTQTLTVASATLVNNSIINASSITKGTSVTLTGKASGGTSPYTYKFEAKESADTGYTLLQNFTTTAAKTWTPKRTGTYSVRITVKDKTGKTVSKTLTLTVKAALTNNSTLSESSITKGGSVKMTAKASGGTGPYTYKFEAKESIDTSYTLLQDFTTTAAKTWTPKRTGTYSVQITVKDSTGKIAAETYTLKVEAAS